MRKYRKLLKAGNKAQLEKLKMNKHKDDFDNLDIYYVFKRMEEELEELRNELFTKDGHRKPYYRIEFLKARHEFSDNANFAHMGILTCDKELKLIVI